MSIVDDDDDLSLRADVAERTEEGSAAEYVLLAADKDGDAKISPAEFNAFIEQAAIAEEASGQDVRDVEKTFARHFQEVDKDQDGRLTHSELQAYIDVVEAEEDAADDEAQAAEHARDAAPLSRAAASDEDAVAMWQQPSHDTAGWEGVQVSIEAEAEHPEQEVAASGEEQSAGPDYDSLE